MGKKISAIGNYNVDGVLLGKGNFAKVELATHKITEIKVCSCIVYCLCVCVSGAHHNTIGHLSRLDAYQNEYSIVFEFTCLLNPIVSRRLYSKGFTGQNDCLVQGMYIYKVRMHTIESATQNM